MTMDGQRARSPLVGIPLVLGSVASVQLGAALAKSLFDDIGPAGLTWLRLGISALIMLIVARPRIRRWDRGTWGAVAIFGIVLGAMNLLYYLAIDRIPIGVAVTLELLGPLVLASAKTRSWRDAVWLVAAVAGVVIVGAQSFRGALDPLGVALALGAGACWAVYILCSERVGQRVDGIGGLAVALVVASIAIAPFGLAEGVGTVIAQPAIVLPALAIALLSSAIPYALELTALRRIPPRVFGILMSLEPAAAALFAFAVLHETIEPIELVAVALVIIASAGVAVTAARAARSARGARPEDDLPPIP